MRQTPDEAHAASFVVPTSNGTAVNGHSAATQPDALLRQMANSLPAMVWMGGPDGQATLFNRRWLEFTGCTLSRAVAGGWVAVIHPDDFERRQARHEEARKAHEPFETEYRIRRADGEFRWILDQSAPRFSMGGEFQGYLGMAVDITERKHAEEELRWLSKAVEQSPATVVITDLAGNIEYVNPKFTEVTGYTPAEVIGQNPRLLKSGETPAAEYRKMWEALQTGGWRGEFHNKRKNGEMYWEAASICPIRDDSGLPTHYMAVKEDITERKRMEVALRASEERFRIAIENAQLSVYDVDRKTGNGTVYGANHFSHGLGTFLDWAQAVHPDDRQRVLTAHERRVENGDGLREEYRIVDRNGNVRHYSDSGAPDCDGRWIGVLRDITGQKQVETSLAQLAAIVECSNYAILSFDAHGTVQSWNTAAEVLYGYSASEIVGQSAAVLSTGDLREPASRDIASVAGGMALPSFETWHLRKDGVAFPVSIAASPIRDRAGKAVGGSAIIQDITEKKRAEECLRESENRFRALLQNSTDILTLIDPAGAILYDSPGISELLGLSPTERMGQAAFQWIHPDDLSYIRMLHEELLLTTGAKMRAQVRLRHADGSWRWCDSWAVNLLDEPGVRALATSFRDITELKGAETALRDSEQRYRRLIEDASDVIFTIDLEGNFTSVNRAGERLTGYDREELMGMNARQIAAPEYLPAIQKNIEERLAGGTPAPLEAELVARDGHRVAIEVSGRLQFRNGIPEGILGIARDISQRKHAERLEHKRREVLEMVAQNQPLDTVLRRLEEMIGQQYPGTAARILQADECGADPPGRVRIPINAGDGHFLGYIEIDLPAGRKITEFEQVRLESKARLAAIAIEQRQLTDRLAFQAQHDPLTGLPNRALLDDRLRQAITLARRLGKMVATIYVDLDRFKFINDTLGHDVGDVLLKEAAKRLEAAVRESDTLARPGGDEFVAVLFGVETSHDAEVVAERIIQAMRCPFEVMGHELFVSASVGLSLFPQDGEDAATLQKHADVAMYEAKTQGRNRYQKFAREMNSASQERLEVETHLHRALERGELLLYYQPQFQTSTGALAGVEALLRWNHPKWGLLLPSRFVPVAEESGMIIPMSLWVLQEACRQHQCWRRAGHPPVRIAINVSATQFMRTNLAQKVADVLAAQDMEPRFLELELTEGVLMRDIHDSARQISELRALGVRISIDDFGTGYSSLSYLQRLPIDDLKIDKCFVQVIGQTSGTQPLVKAIVGLAHGLHMTATAEGVETEQQFKVLQSLCCDRIQGFLLGRPAPPEVWAAHWQTDVPYSILNPGWPADLRG